MSKQCSYLCGEHLEPCVFDKSHHKDKSECKCSKCAIVTHICNIKPDHEHDYSGWMLSTKNGEILEDTPENRERSDVDGQTAVCSICGRAAIEDAYWM